MRPAGRNPAGAARGHAPCDAAARRKGFAPFPSSMCALRARGACRKRAPTGINPHAPTQVEAHVPTRVEPKLELARSSLWLGPSRGARKRLHTGRAARRARGAQTIRSMARRETCGAEGPSGPPALVVLAPTCALLRLMCATRARGACHVERAIGVDQGVHAACAGGLPEAWPCGGRQLGRSPLRAAPGKVADEKRGCQTRLKIAHVLTDRPTCCFAKNSLCGGRKKPRKHPEKAEKPLTSSFFVHDVNDHVSGTPRDMLKPPSRLRRGLFAAVLRRARPKPTPARRQTAGARCRSRPLAFFAIGASANGASAPLPENALAGIFVLERVAAGDPSGRFDRTVWKKSPDCNVRGAFWAASRLPCERL